MNGIHQQSLAIFRRIEHSFSQEQPLCSLHSVERALWQIPIIPADGSIMIFLDQLGVVVCDDGQFDVDRRLTFDEFGALVDQLIDREASVSFGGDEDRLKAFIEHVQQMDPSPAAQSVSLAAIQSIFRDFHLDERQLQGLGRRSLCESLNSSTSQRRECTVTDLTTFVQSLGSLAAVTEGERDMQKFLAHVRAMRTLRLRSICLKPTLQKTKSRKKSLVGVLAAQRLSRLVSFVSGASADIPQGDSPAPPAASQAPASPSPERNLHSSTGDDTPPGRDQSTLRPLKKSRFGQICAEKGVSTKEWCKFLSRKPLPKLTREERLAMYPGGPPPPPPRPLNLSLPCLSDESKRELQKDVEAGCAINNTSQEGSKAGHGIVDLFQVGGHYRPQKRPPVDPESLAQSIYRKAARENLIGIDVQVLQRNAKRNKERTEREIYRQRISR